MPNSDDSIPISGRRNHTIFNATPRLVHPLDQANSQDIFIEIWHEGIDDLGLLDRFPLPQDLRYFGYLPPLDRSPPTRPGLPEVDVEFFPHWFFPHSNHRTV
jgi:hypothetical protein